MRCKADRAFLRFWIGRIHLELKSPFGEQVIDFDVSAYNVNMTGGSAASDLWGLSGFVYYALKTTDTPGCVVIP